MSDVQGARPLDGVRVVELGQLLVVALVWVVLRFAAGHLEAARYQRWLDNGSAALCSLGVYWFISRSLIAV